MRGGLPGENLKKPSKPDPKGVFAMMVSECRGCLKIKRIERNGRCESCLLAAAEKRIKTRTAGKPHGRPVLVHDSPYLPPMKGWLIHAEADPGTVWVRIAASFEAGMYPAEIVELERLEAVA
jgi:hypothetical protein